MDNLNSVYAYWEEIFSTNSPAVGGLLLLSGPGSYSALAAWPLVNLSLMKAHKLYQKSYIFFSPKTQERICKNPVIDSWGISTAVTESAERKISPLILHDYLLDSLLDEIFKLEDNSSVVIAIDNTYCWKEEPSFQAERTLIGAERTFELSSPEIILSERIFQLCRKLVPIIRKKNLFIIVGSECPPQELPSDLNNIPELGYVQCGGPAMSRQYPRMIENIVISQGVNAAKQCIAKFEIDDVHKKQLTVLALYFAGRYIDALTFMRENLSPYESIDNAFSYVQLAQLAGDTSVLAEFSKYIVNNLPDDSDRLRICLNLGIEQQDDELFLASLRLFEQLYPNHPDVTEFKYINAVFRDEYDSALKYAKDLKDDYKQTLCRISISDTATWVSQIRDYAGENKPGLVICLAKKLYQRNDINSAFDILSKNDFKDNKFEKGKFSLLLEIYEKNYLLMKNSASYKNHFDYEYLLVEAIKYTSSHSEDREARIRWRDFLADRYDKTLSVALLAKYIYSTMVEIPRIFDETPPSICLLDGDLEKEIDVKKILRDNAMTNSTTLLFHTTSIQTDSSLEVLASVLCKSIAHIDYRSGKDSLLICLDLLHRVSYQLGIDNDIYACYDAVLYLSEAGFHQDAKNLAETTLSIMTKRTSEPANLSREVLKWEMFARAFQLSNNNIDALLYLVNAVYIVSNCSVPPKSLWLKLLRNVTLILRDNRLFDFALNLVDIEASLIANERELRHVRYSCEILQLLEDQNTVELVELFTDIDKYIGTESEKAPYLSLQATIVNCLDDEAKKQIPIALLDNFQKNIASLEGTSGERIKNFLACEVDVSKFKMTLTGIRPSINLYDFKMQFSGFDNFLQQTINCAHQSQDVDLFLMASELKANPFVVLMQVDSDDDSTLLRKMSQELLFQKGFRDKPALQKQFIELQQKCMSQYNLSFLDEITSGLILNVLAPDEVILCLAWDKQHVLNSCLLTPNGIGEFQKLSIEWCNSARTWLEERETAYDERDISKIDDILHAINIPIPNNINIKRCYLLPPIDLFGFPFLFLTEKENYTSINVIPSLTWFVRNRKKQERLPGNHECIAWLGSLETSDETLELLRSQIIDLLIAHEFITSEEDSPKGCANRKLSIVACHGDFISSMTLTDGQTAFLASDFSAYFNDTQVVIIFACSAGSGTYNRLWNEIDSMAEKLLANNVACVIAPTFPISLGTVTIWLNYFLNHSIHGVSQAALDANRILRYQNEYQMAWGNLHIYGDGNIVL